MNNLRDWNRRLFDELVGGGNSNRKVRLFVDGNRLSALTDGLSPEEAVRDFAASYRNYFSSGPKTILENAIDEAVAWRSSNTFQEKFPPLILSTLCLIVLSVTEDKSHKWSVYRLLNEHLEYSGVDPESIPADPPKGYEQIPRLFEFWNQWLDQFKGEYGQPLTWSTKLERFKYQAPARAHAFIESRDVKTIHQYFFESGYSVGDRLNGEFLCAQFEQWCRFDESSFSRRVTKYLEYDPDDVRELLNDILLQEFLNWNGQVTNLANDSLQVTVLVQIDRNELDPQLMWRGIVPIDRRLEGMSISINAREILLESDDFVTVMHFKECSNNLRLPSSKSIQLNKNVEARFAERQFLVMASEQYFDGDLTEQRIIHLNTQYEILAPSECESSMRDSLDAYHAVFDEARNLGNLIHFKKVVFSQSQPSRSVDFSFRFPIQKQEKPVLVGGLKTHESKYLIGFLPRISLPMGVGLVKVNDQILGYESDSIDYSLYCREGRNRLLFSNGVELFIDVIKEGQFAIRSSPRGHSVGRFDDSATALIDPHLAQTARISHPFIVSGASSNLVSLGLDEMQAQLNRVRDTVIEFKSSFVEHFLYNPNARMIHFQEVSRSRTWGEREFLVWTSYIDLAALVHDFLVSVKATNENCKDFVYLLSRILTSHPDNSKSEWRLEIRKIFIKTGEMDQISHNKSTQYSFRPAGKFIKSIVQIQRKQFIDNFDRDAGSLLFQELSRLALTDHSNQKDDSLFSVFKSCFKEDETTFPNNKFDTLIVWLSEQSQGSASFDAVREAIQELCFSPPFDYFFETLRQLELSCRVEVDMENRTVTVLRPCLVFQKRTTPKLGILLGGSTLRQNFFIRNSETRESADYALRKIQVHTRGHESIQGSSKDFGAVNELISFPLSDPEVLYSFLDQFGVEVSFDIQKLYEERVPSLKQVINCLPRRSPIQNSTIYKLFEVGPVVNGSGRRFVPVDEDSRPGIYKYTRGKQSRYLIRFEDGERVLSCPLDWMNHLFLLFPFLGLAQNRGSLTNSHIIKMNSKTKELACPRYLRLPLIYEQYIFLRTLRYPIVNELEVIYQGVDEGTFYTLIEKLDLDAENYSRFNLRVERSIEYP